MEYKDYYKIMGLERNASSDDIKKAYRKLARKYHPDVSKEKDAEDKFKSVGEAYEVLKDPQKRASYDQLGANWQQGQDFRPPPGWQQQHQAGRQESPFDFDSSDFFESLFGASMGGRRGSRRDHSMPGEDLHGKVQISLQESYNGTSRQVQIPNTEVINGQLQRTTKTLNVKIPAGVKSGKQIRLAGQGSKGKGAGKQGDVLLEVEVLKDPFYDLIDNDVYCTLPIAPWEAALGAKVSVPTLGGKVELKIPAGSQGGQKMRLKGRGIPGNPPGDQYIILKIIIPIATTDAMRALYEKMAQEMPFNPRENIGA